MSSLLPEHFFNCAVSLRGQYITPGSILKPRSKRPTLATHTWESTYPSPPMSSPPSPIRRQHSEVPTTSAPGQPPGQPGPSTEAPSPVTTAVQQAGTRSTLQASLSISITEQQQPQITTAGATSAVPLERHTFYTAPGPGESTNVPAVGAPLRSGITASTSRPARRSKAHVASACINCKRAHLSCDVQRPCSRCVASGKQVGGGSPLPPSIASLMMSPRIPALMCNTRNVVDRDFGRRASSAFNDQRARLLLPVSLQHCSPRLRLHQSDLSLGQDGNERNRFVLWPRRPATSPTH